MLQPALVFFSPVHETAADVVRSSFEAVGEGKWVDAAQDVTDAVEDVFCGRTVICSVQYNLVVERAVLVLFECCTVER